MNSVKTIAVRNTPQEINLSNITHKEDVPTPLRQDIVSRLRYIEDLKFFLVTAPIKWMDGQVIRKYYLNEELGYISCIYWENLYYITGTDIIKILIFRFEKFGRHIINKKKFEEGIFSDLRNLKVDEHCILQLPRSPMLQFLHKNYCIKTQKKQKVFFWFSVVHDRLFADCLERDLKRE
ncbi:STE-domain-containing protein, partial [Hanseniaspora valbyensis NRRL Y-1626]